MLGPIYFGKLIDGLCLQWEGGCGAGGGACLLYDNDQLRLQMMGFMTLFRGVAAVMIAVAFLWAKRTRHLRHKAPQGVMGISVVEGVTKVTGFNDVTGVTEVTETLYGQ
ncbi:hypothetical protein ACOMHN_002837 [Nucella lapillus]